MDIKLEPTDEEVTPAQVIEQSVTQVLELIYLLKLHMGL
jgi:hypothetical protein